MQFFTEQSSTITSSSAANVPADRVERWSLIAVGVLVAFYLGTSLYIAAHRFFWFDEILTVYVARQPNWATIWAALMHAADGMTPVYDVAVWTFTRLFGNSEVAARLPSILAMSAGMLITFDCASRLTDKFHGLIALSVLTCSFLPNYGYEARAYAIYFMFAALALWIWTNTPNDSMLSAALIGVVCFLGVAFHYYFLLCLAPYAIWEIWRWRPGKPISRKLLAGIAGVMTATALLSPVILSFSRKFPRPWNQPTPRDLLESYTAIYPYAEFLLAMALVWIVLNQGEEEPTRDRMQDSESVGWLFFCIPVAGFLLAEVKTHAFMPRYSIGMLPGVAVAISCCLWRHYRNLRRVSLGILFGLVILGGAAQLHRVREMNSDPAISSISSYLKLAESLHNDGKRYMVFARPLQFLAAQYYIKDSTEVVLLLPQDFDPNRVEPDCCRRILVNLSQYHPLQFWRPDDLKRHAHEAALIASVPDVGWARDLQRELKRAGFQLQVKLSEPAFEVLYLE